MTYADFAWKTAKELLLDPWGIDESHLQAALREIKTQSVDWADLYFQYARNESWSLDESQVKSGYYAISQGVGVRAVVGDKTAYAYSDVLSPEALMKAAKTVKSIAQYSQEQSVPIEMKVGDYLPLKTSLYAQLDPALGFESQHKIDILKKIDVLARRQSPYITRVNASLSTEYDVVLIANSEGLRVADIRPLVHLSISVTMQKEGRHEFSHTGGGSRTDLNFFTDELIQSYVDKVVKECLNNLEAVPAPSGEMTVVLGNGWPGILLHEAVGHGLEGDFNRKGSSAFSGRIGERVASPGVTVIDDGTIAYRRGSLNIDDEGSPTERTVLIEDGYLTNYMQDHLNARLMGMRTTGNCRREDYASMPMPRMTNTFMLAGDYDPAEMIASVKKGIYAANFSGGQVDITNGNFTFSASESYLIEEGKITRPLKGATLIGNGAQVMQQISMIGNDMALDSGMGICGKQGQSVPVGVGSPTLKLDKITVGGTGGII